MERRLAAILAADIVGYSRLMGANEVGTLGALKEIRSDVFDHAVSKEGGRIFKLMGDGIFAEFGSVVNALRAAMSIQQAMSARNRNVPEDRQIRFRMGVNIGDVLVEDGDLFGDGVNIASRIEALAHPGGIAVSGAARDQIGSRIDAEFEEIGPQALKNIDEPVTLYHVHPQNVGAAAASGSKQEERPSIAVLPFANMSGDPEQEFFADGIAEDLITDLSNLSGLFVVGRYSAFVYKGKAANLKEIAKALGVRYILEGSVRKAGQRVRITGQLIDGLTGGHIWAERYDRDLSDIFALQDEITKAIIEQLQVRLLGQPSVSRASTKSAEAYTCYLKGRQLFHMRSKTNIEEARTHFLEALQHDQTYARAYVGLADCESRLNDWYGGNYPVEDILAMIRRALEIEPEMAEAYAARGLAKQIAGQENQAPESYEKALAQDPLCYEAHHYYARYLRVSGDLQKCAYHFVRALEIMPDDYRSPLLVDPVFQEMGRLGESERYRELGLKRAEEAVKRNPDHLDPLELVAVVLAQAGDHGRAREWVERSIAMDPDRSLSNAYNVACVYALIGDVEHALEWIERSASNLGQSQLNWMRVDTDLDSIRSHPRFLALFNEN